jgi:ribosomal-protein-alanine N-acetyltransferase
VSARLDTLPRYRRMTAHDLDTVLAIEEAIYPYAWTRGNFSDSLAAGYHCWIVECGGEVAGYSVVMIGAEEGHLLNLSVAGPWQRQGLGREILAFVVKLARDYAAARILLEVRPSNVAARALYATAGFAEIGVRRGYYPAGEAREDAIVLELLRSRTGTAGDKRHGITHRDSSAIE